MRPDGYVKVPELLAHSKYKGVTEEQVRAVVKDNDKQRYALLEEDGVLLIRANQGHSLPVSVGLSPFPMSVPTQISSSSAL